MVSIEFVKIIVSYLIIIIIIFKIYIAPLTYKIIKGAEHMLKSTEWKKKTTTKDWSPDQASAQTEVLGYHQASTESEREDIRGKTKGT